jgi:aerobic carbon-monoxide dehydrogenase large subunit
VTLAVRTDPVQPQKTGIGQPVRRKEDFRLLTGRGRYSDDVTLPGMAHAVFVRSLHAHARIVSIDKRAALAAPGVLAVLTGADYLAAGLGPIPHNPGLSAPPDVQARLRGSPPIATCHYPLPTDRVRFVGEPVVLVVAETITAAKDAAELVEIVWAPLPTVVRAAADGGPRRRRGRSQSAGFMGRGAGQCLHRHRGR